MKITDDLHQQTGYDLMAAVFEVCNEMGNGFLEEVYHESLGLELNDRKIPLVNKPTLILFYKGRALQKQYQPDLIIVGEIAVGTEGSQVSRTRTRSAADQLSPSDAKTCRLSDKLRFVSKT